MRHPRTCNAFASGVLIAQTASQSHLRVAGPPQRQEKCGHLHHLLPRRHRCQRGSREPSGPSASGRQAFAFIVLMQIIALSIALVGWRTPGPQTNALARRGDPPGRIVRSPPQSMDRGGDDAHLSLSDGPRNRTPRAVDELVHSPQLRNRIKSRQENVFPELQTEPPMPARAAQSTTVVNPDAASMAQWKPRVNPWAIAATVALAAFMEVLTPPLPTWRCRTLPAPWARALTKHVGADQLPGFKRNRVAAGRMGFKHHGPPEFFCHLHRDLYGCEFPVRRGAYAGHAAGFPGDPGSGRRRHAAHGPGYYGRQLEPQKRGQAFALYGLVAVLAPSIGPTLGGWITDNFSWRWIFFINIPVGILAFFLVTRLVEDPPWIKADRSKLRTWITWASHSSPSQWAACRSCSIRAKRTTGSRRVSSGSLRSCLSAASSGWWCGSGDRKNPLINLRLFRFKNFAICCFLMMLVGGVLNANTVLQPEFTQQLLGYTATTAGLALTAGGIALVIMMPLAGSPPANSRRAHWRCADSPCSSSPSATRP